MSRGVTSMRVRTRLAIGLLTVVGLMAGAAWIIIGQQSIITHAFSVHCRLTDIDRLLLECRRQEKNIQLRDDDASRSRFTADVSALHDATTALAQAVESVELQRRLDELHRLVDGYAEAAALSTRRVPGHGHDTAAEERTVAAAQACHAVTRSMLEDARATLHDALLATRRLSMASVVGGLLLAGLLASLLTAGTVRQLEELRRLAEDATTGDIQDIDVELQDLDLERFSTVECHDLAVALRSMVGSLRALVSSERGLMPTYQMTLVALVSRAVGSSAWAILERARAAAGFTSLSEVQPESVAQLLTELEPLLQPLLPKPSLNLLLTTIRQLEL